jgi:c-di-GMP-binding flagellar brake protein YcgR
VLITNDERRVFRRMAIEAAVTITRGNTQLQGTCKDLSSTGMLLQLHEANLNPDDQIQILLSTHDSRFPPLDVEARVVRVTKEDHMFIVATEFLTVK